MGFIENILSSPLLGGTIGAIFTIAYMKSDLSWIKVILTDHNERIKELENKKK